MFKVKQNICPTVLSNLFLEKKMYMTIILDKQTNSMFLLLSAITCKR